jgi:hypothetical protein
MSNFAFSTAPKKRFHAENYGERTVVTLMPSKEMGFGEIKKKTWQHF